MIRFAIVFELAGLLASLASASQARPLNSSERAEFARDFSVGCMTGPHIKSMIESLGGKNRERREYCDCAGSYFARKLTIEQASNSKSVAPSLHAQARDYCVKKLFGGNRKAK
ncbi:hypothetical protein BFX40_02715 [Mesorhizobium sp. SEMIA 3007]|uniref:hypothetical protein n=1 Tax=Mesorhizobium TaxID=68287 RepID=UPI0005707AE4|nr:MULTISPECIES: hypothetical protein [Mesorhizobium]MCH4559641.1 hypothetical protein [Mesorhizobium jarvisii]ODA91906.1 hypothetical protein BFX40_02715 [Mesorhizobium sp. SEMIA 3007]QGU20778.1 hypothetical protein MCHK_09725 [Mesorhizobium huakuii 7653R]